MQGRANANLAAGYGFTGILVAFLARHNPLAIIPVAMLLGGIGASGGLAAAPARPARCVGAGAAGHDLRRRSWRARRFTGASASSGAKER